MAEAEKIDNKINDLQKSIISITGIKSFKSGKTLADTVKNFLETHRGEAKSAVDIFEAIESLHPSTTKGSVDQIARSLFKSGSIRRIKEGWATKYFIPNPDDTRNNPGGFTRPNYGIGRALIELIDMVNKDDAQSAKDIYGMLKDDFPKLTQDDVVRELKRHCNNKNIRCIEIDGEMKYYSKGAPSPKEKVIVAEKKIKSYYKTSDKILEVMKSGKEFSVNDLCGIITDTKKNTMHVAAQKLHEKGILNKKRKGKVIKYSIKQ